MTTVVVVASLLAGILSTWSTASAVIVSAGPTTVATSTYSHDTATYTFGTYETENERVSGVSITFPAEFDVSSATAIEPAGTVDVSGQTVSIEFAQPIERRTEFSVALGGIVNPSDPGVYSFGPITAYRLHQVQERPLDPPHTLETAPATIVAPHLSVTLSTSMLSFDLYPEVPAPPQEVVLTVDSSHDFTISRTIAGQPDSFGLTITGEAEGHKPPGTATFTDSYSAEAPWTTEGDRTYTATVTYTVVQ